MSGERQSRDRFLDPGDAATIARVSRFIMQMRPLAGEKVGDAEAAVADFIAKDPREDDRRLRREILRSVAENRMTELPGSVDPEELRLAVFRETWKRGGLPSVLHDDLFAVDRSEIFGAVAPQFGIEPSRIPEFLFADTPAERLLVFPAGGEDAVAANAVRRLNLERLRHALRKAVGVCLQLPSRVHVGSPYVRILWGAKRLGLMYDLTEAGGGVTMDVSGPLSLFGRTTMYGNRLFDFVRELLWTGAKGWKLRVDFAGGAGVRVDAIRNLWLDGSIAPRFVDALVSEPQMRSGDEEAFARSFARYAPEWQLDYEGAILSLSDGSRRYLMVPDFVARNASSRREVLIEIIGFWRREYLARKLEKLRLLEDRHLVLLINRRLSVARDEPFSAGPGRADVYYYAGREDLKKVAQHLAMKLKSLPTAPSHAT